MSIPVVLGGHHFQVDDEHAGFWTVAVSGEWEPATIAALTTLLRPGDLFVDIGAWIGPTTLVAAAQGSHVIAYEPDPHALRGLHANLALNPGLDVEVRPVALYVRDGRANMAASTGTLGDSTSSLVAGRVGSPTVDVELVDVRHLVLSEEFRGARLVKIDIEGAEFDLVRRIARALPRDPPPLLLSLHGLAFKSRFARWPRRLRAVLWRLASTRARAVLLFRLRRYTVRQVPDQSVPGRWRRAHARDLVRVIVRPVECEVLFADSELS